MQKLYVKYIFRLHSPVGGWVEEFGIEPMISRMGALCAYRMLRQGDWLQHRLMLHVVSFRHGGTPPISRSDLFVVFPLPTDLAQASS